MRQTPFSNPIASLVVSELVINATRMRFKPAASAPGFLRPYGVDNWNGESSGLDNNSEKAVVERLMFDA